MGTRSVSYGDMVIATTGEMDELSAPEQILGKMSSVLANFGYSSFLICSIPELTVGKPFFLLNGWPDGWSDLYQRLDYYKDDPCAAKARSTLDPFEWSEVLRYDTERFPRADEVMGAAAEFALKKGFVVPVLYPDGSMGAVTMAGEYPEFDPVAKRAIHLLALYTYGRVLSIIGNEKWPTHKVLNAAEREVLTWAAAGKSNWVISEILKIPESTVDWRLRQATKKLGAATKIQAVATAVRAKEIDP